MRDFALNKLGCRSGNIIDLRDATQAELLSAFGSKESHKGQLFDYVRDLIRQMSLYSALAMVFRECQINVVICSQ